MMKTLNTIIELPQDIIDIQKIFTTNGYKLYVVGGAVRDHLLGKKPHDFDLVTDTTPENVMGILHSYNTDLQGVHFGVVRVFTELEKEGHEIASYRVDISLGRDTKGDDKKVDIGEHITIEDDVKRRDLTINALFYDIEKEQIVDYVGGISDLKNNIIRTVGEASERFKEDRLRIIRTIRFSATTLGTIEEETYNAIKNDNRLFGISDIDDVSRERIFAEFNKIIEKSVLNNDNRIIKVFVDLLVELGIMEQIFPLTITKKPIVPTSHLTIAIAQVLVGNSITDDFKDKLVSSKSPTKFINVLSTLVDIYRNGIDINRVNTVRKNTLNKGVTDDILSEWITIMDIQDNIVKTLLKYQPSVSGKDLLSEGFKGMELGEEMRRRETEIFKSLM